VKEVGLSSTVGAHDNIDAWAEGLGNAGFFVAFEAYEVNLQKEIQA
jgi:hypothetical protein